MNGFAGTLINQSSDNVISVIIPTYNSKQYICEAIDSVLKQSYKACEIIVVDDGSSDNTEELVKSVYPSVRYFYSAHKGVSAARNRGIKMAKGDFVAFLDADDRWVPQKIEKQLALFKADACASMIFTEHSSFYHSRMIQNTMNKRRLLMHGDLVKNIFLKSYITTSTVMVRKSVFDSTGPFEEDLAIAEDDNMWMRIAMRYKVILLDEPLVLYRVTEGSLSSDYKKVLAEVIKHIELLKSNYPEIIKRLGQRVIRRKYSDLHFCEAYQLFSQKEYGKARVHFIKSICFYPCRIRDIMYLCASFLPRSTIDTLKLFKQTMRKRALTIR